MDKIGKSRVCGESEGQMITAKKTLLLLLTGIALALTGCGGTENASEGMRTEGLDKLGTISVIAREEGSGTRSTFAQLVDFEGGTQDKQSDLTRSDAQIKENARQVIEAVEADSAAIGYVSGGALYEDGGVKAVSVNGVMPGIQDGKYPLGRAFYLTWCGSLNDLEEDFLTYVHGAGQEIVGEDYISVAKSTTFLSNKASGRIVIDGSTSVGPLMEKLAEGYMERNPNAEIVVTQSDSTTGLTNAMAGNCDFGMSSKELKDYEKELLDYETIARDEIAVIVSQDNPLENITTKALRAIYTGEWDSWNDCK